MRFQPAAFAASALLFGASAVLAQDQCSCPSSNDAGSISSGWTPPASYQPAPQVVPVPKVQATKQTIQDGTQQAIQQLTNQNILPGDVAGQIQQAINNAIAQHGKQVTAGVPVTTTNANGSPTVSVQTVTVTPSTTVVPSTVTVEGQESTVYVTQTITSLPPGATILPNSTINALNSIEDAIRDAIAAVNLSKTGLDANAQGELQACLNAVLENGGLPQGYSCVTQTGSTSGGLKSTFNNILEQFLGILPAKIIDEIQDAVMPMMTGLLPDEKTLLNNIGASMSSVIASLSGNSVSAIEMMQSCYSLAIKQNSNTSYLQCYMGDGGPFDTLQTATNSVIQQFVGVLPGSLLESVQNLTASTFKAGANSDLSSIGSNLTSQLDNALTSVTDSLTGNAVTLMQQLQTCLNLVVKDCDADAAKQCLTQAPAQTAQTMVSSVAQQFSGYLPSSFFSDLVSTLDHINTTANGGNFTKTQLVDALEGAFNNANIGPAYVGCFNQVQSCVLANIQSTNDINANCPGPVAGCELIGSQNSTSLANTTMDAQLSASSAAAATSTIISANSTSVASSTDASSSVSSSVLPSGDSTGSSSSSVIGSSSSPVVAAAATGSPKAMMKAEELSSSVESSSAPASSAPASSAPASSAPATTAPASSAAESSKPVSSTPAPSSAGSSSAPASNTAGGSTMRQKMVRRRAESHKNLRRMYAEHYGTI